MKLPTVNRLGVGLAWLIIVLLPGCKRNQTDGPAPQPLAPKVSLRAVGNVQYLSLEPGKAPTRGIAAEGDTLTWVLQVRIPGGAASLATTRDGRLLPGYPQTLTQTDTTFDLRLRDLLPTGLPDSVQYEFAITDKLGRTGTYRFWLQVQTLALMTDRYLFAQDVTAADTAGMRLGGAPLGCYFSTLTGRAYTQAEAEAQPEKIDLTLAGADAGEIVGLYLITPERRFRLGADDLPNAGLGFYTAINSPQANLPFYRDNTAQFNALERQLTYSNNAPVFATTCDEAGCSYYHFMAAPQDPARGIRGVRGRLRVKEVRNARGSTSNKKKVIRFDVRFYFLR